MKLKFKVVDIATNSIILHAYNEIRTSTIKIKYDIRDSGVLVRFLEFFNISDAEKTISEIRGIFNNPKILSILKECIHSQSIPSDLVKMSKGRLYN